MSTQNSQKIQKSKAKTLIAESTNNTGIKEVIKNIKVETINEYKEKVADTIDTEANEQNVSTYSKSEINLQEVVGKNLSTKTQSPQMQSIRNTTQQTENLIATLVGANTKDKGGKDGQKGNKEQSKNTKINEMQEVQSKQIQNEEVSMPFEETISQYVEEETSTLTESVGGEKKPKEKTQNSEETKETKSQKKPSQKQATEVQQVKENTRTQILYRSAIARDNIKYFAQNLREEIINYKPPLTKLSMELNPRNLGTLELTITKKGKDLHVQVVSNTTAIGLFMQNQIDFRNNLAQVGFENVDLSFSSNDGKSGDNSNGRQDANKDSQSGEKGNENSLEDSQIDEINVMNITLPKYA